MDKYCIVWMRFGPYHLARLRGAAQCLGSDGVRVTGLEIAGKDHYGWEEAEGADGFERVTVFPNADYGDLGGRQIARGVRQALGEIRPSAVGINGWGVPEARAALSWCKKHGRTAVLMSETKEDECRRRRWKEWLKGRLVRKFDAALVGGRPHENYVVKLGMPEERVFLGYDVVDNEYFSSQSDRARRRCAQLEAGGGNENPEHRERKEQDGSARPPGKGSLIRSLLPARPYFYANTRFLARKNLDGLLRAYAIYRSKADAPWNLVITGDGEEHKRLLALRSELGLSECVQFPGFVQYDELPAYYGLASAFIHPARSEPWGLVVNEACASGLPVLVSHTVGARYELVRNRENGYLCDPFDEEDIADQMLRLGSLSPARRSEMGGRSREIVGEWGPERFGWGFLQAIRSAETS